MFQWNNGERSAKIVRRIRQCARCRRGLQRVDSLLTRSDVELRKRHVLVAHPEMRRPRRRAKQLISNQHRARYPVKEGKGTDDLIARIDTFPFGGAVFISRSTDESAMTATRPIKQDESSAERLLILVTMLCMITNGYCQAFD